MVNDMKKKIPKFKRQQPLKRLKDTWRRPRGKDSKMRKGIKGKPKMPKIGYKSSQVSKTVPIIRNKNDVNNLDTKTVKEIIISKTVGKKKRMEIIEIVEGRGIKVLNKGKL